MQKPTPKKPALDGAAAQPHLQAEVAKDQPKSATPKPAETGRKQRMARGESESQIRSR